MVDRKGAETETSLTQEPDRRPRGRLTLLVVGSGPVATYPLPAQGEVTIGRGSGNAIALDDASVSREHALLRIGDQLEIVDLDSRHGTRLREEPLAPGMPSTFELGDAIHVGSSLLVVQAAFKAERPRRIWSHEIFEARLEEECDRLDRQGRPFGVLRACVEPAMARAAEQSFGGVLRAGDVACVYAPGEYEFLLIDTPAEEVQAVALRLQAAAQGAGLDIRTGMACAPRDGRSADELISLAGRQLRPDGRTGPAAARPTMLTPTFQRLQPLLERVAPSMINVLVLGETGVGKEILAETIHRLSARASKPLLRINCAALTESLLESELFGHEKGAFTGALRDKPGLFENTEGGTVFLDEVGELPPAIQVKLLRVLEDKQVTRVGGLKPRSIDVRFIAATNRDLEAEVTRGGFRSDLFFRLNGISLVLAPLRDRPEEIPLLARTFIADFARAAHRVPEPALSDDALQALTGYSWPGNVRELRNVIERALLLCTGDTILPAHLSGGKLAKVQLAPRPPDPGPADETTAEERRIREVLEQCGGNQTRAAQILGISRRTLGVKLDRYNLPRPRRSN